MRFDIFQFHKNDLRFRPGLLNDFWFVNTRSERPVDTLPGGIEYMDEADMEYFIKRNIERAKSKFLKINK
jgi:hypothetical protein